LLLLSERRVSEHYSRDQGLSHNWVRALCEDHEGNVWAATGNGFNTLVPRKIGWLSAPDLFQGCAVFSLAVSTDGSAWMGTEGAGLYHYSTKGRWTRYSQADGISNLFVWSVLQTRQDKILAGTWGGGVLTRNKERFESEPLLNGLNSPVLSMFESQNGTLWVGTTTGLHQYRESKLLWSVGEEKLALPDVRAIAEGADGTIWFGMSGGGLGAVKDGKVRQFRKSDGAGSDFVLCVYAGADDSIWYGTADNGLARMKDSRFSFVRPENGLPASTISHIVQDGNGDFWLGSLGGLLRARKEDLEKCANGATQSVRFLAFGRDDGMLSQTCSGGFQPGACRAPDGRLWFPTSRGVAVVNPATVSTNLVPPPILIEEFRVDTPRSTWKKLVASPSEPSQLRIEPGRHRIQITYTGLSYAAPAKVRFRHRLEGLETEWVDAGTRREAEYAYLRPGEYRFRVIGCNNDDVWNETGAEISFVVFPFFWQTLWFQITGSLAGGLALAAGVWGVSRRRVRRKMELLEQQRALERERARIARDIHDDLGASLTRITLLSQSVRGEVQALAPAAREVDAIYETARNLTRSMDEIVWAVNPKHDSLDSLVTYLGRFAQAFLSSAGLRCRLDLPLTLPPCRLTSEVRHNVFLAFKEALNNVVKHARATEVRISMEIRSDEEGLADPSLAGFTLVVTDNGRGFDFSAGAETQDATAEARLATGNGIYNMRKRLEEIGGVCEWTTAPGEGARVRFVLPALPRHQKTGQSFPK
jgi:signal transduction histidine kinase